MLPNTSPKKLYIKTYGCQMNVYDSERMEDLILPLGYQKTEQYQDADMVVLNTCHIREKAAEKVYSDLGRINKSKEKNNKEMIIAVAGCVGQAEGNQIFKRAPFVDIVVGSQSFHNLPALIRDINKKQGRHLLNLDFSPEDKFDSLANIEKQSAITGFLSIQEGCDKFCTFCVVPYTRGAEFSRSLTEILKEAQSLADKGMKEITLLGQNVNAYHGLDEQGNVCSLGKLIKILAKIDGIERIRYITSHPRDMHDELYEAHATEKKLMPFLHLPIQSGSDRILDKMNRKHKANEYLAIIKKLEIARPGLVFSSDFIVGFPGETDEDFNDTLELVRKMNYAQCFSFKYSPRPGTPAANSKDQIPEEVKTARLATLQDLLDEKQYGFNKTCLGKEMKVLFDRKGKKDGQLIGRSEFLQPVCVDIAEEYLGKICNVKITHAAPYSLNGEIC
jgi:tRNA-2-methylthio-N6-dimethylallyladenosine synthase